MSVYLSLLAVSYLFAYLSVGLSLCLSIGLPVSLRMWMCNAFIIWLIYSWLLVICRVTWLELLWRKEAVRLVHPFLQSQETRLCLNYPLHSGGCLPSVGFLCCWPPSLLPFSLRCSRYTVVLTYYLFCLIMFLLLRPIITIKFSSNKSGSTPLFFGLYAIPILVVVYAVLGGLLCKFSSSEFC